MKIRLLILALLLPVTAHAQLWTGILSTARAYNWQTYSGISGGIPDGSWTQLGSTLAAGSYTGATITSNIASCSNQYYLLGPGTFTITGKIQFPTSGNCAIRGSGTNQTILTMSGAGSTCANANITALICAESSDGSYATEPPPNTCTITAGLTQGSTSITLSNLAGTCLSGIVANKTLLILDWCDTGFSGSSCSGTSTDNGAAFVSDTQYNATGPVGCCEDTTGNNARPFRSQVEVHTATAVNTGTGVVTLSEPIATAAFGNNPQVWIVQPVQNVGVENLTITGTSSTAPVCIQVTSALNFWVSGVAFDYCYLYHVDTTQSAHGVEQNSYLFSGGGATEFTYGFRCQICSFVMIQNNIFHNVFAPVVFDGPSSGDVVGYNAVFTQGNGSGDINWSFQDHYYSTADLFEGNYGIVSSGDGAHATSDFITQFRNFYIGWASNPSAVNNYRTNAAYTFAFRRYYSYLLNVLGTPGYHTTYESDATPLNNQAIYALGTGDSSSVPSDSTTYTTSMLWGNFDTVHAATQWNSGEVPSTDPNYPNPVPTGCTSGGGCTASFYLASKPSWFGSVPWPPIGPDVSGGNVIQCGGTINTVGNYNGLPALATSGTCPTGGTGWAGHVNANPAMAYYIALGGALDGTGAFLSNFNAAQYTAGNAQVSGAVTVSGNAVVQ